MSNQSFRSYWVVIPGLNEEKYLAQVLAKVQSITPNIIFVDDGSSDRSVEIAKRYTSHVLHHRVNLGKGAALKTGCEYAFNTLGAQAVVFIDSDDQHDPQELPQFFKALKQGHEVIFGVRAFNQNMPTVRVLFNKLASLMIKILFGRYIPDIPSGFKALSSVAYQEVRWEATDYSVEMEIAAKVAKKKIDYAIVPIKTIYHDLDRGMTLLDGAKIVFQVCMWRISL